MTNSLELSEAPGDLSAGRRRSFRTLTGGRWSLIVGAVIVGVFLLIALIGPWLAPEPLNTTVGANFAPPSGSHLLGLDDGGQDVLSQLIYGTRQSMIIGLAAALVSGIIGTLIGVAAGYFGGWVDSILMRFTDYILVLPFVPLAIVVATIRGASLYTEIAIIGCLLWANTARVVRAPVMSIRNRLFVSRSKAMGASNLRILGLHVLPQVTALLVATTVLAVATAIFADTAMSFLGLGVPNGSSWGQMIDIAFRRGAISGKAWWAIMPPGICVAIVVLGCSLLGRHLEQQMNPRLRVSYLNPGTFTTRPAAVVATQDPAASTAEPDGVRTEPFALQALDLRVQFDVGGRTVDAVRGVSLSLERGERFGIVGESGCGKTTLILALLGLSAPNALVSGQVLFNGADALIDGERSMARHRWTDIAWVPQGAMNAFNPVRTLGWQMREAILRSEKLTRNETRDRAAELFERVGIPAGRLDRFPHEFSGGMKQRASIAMALAAKPSVLLADEPTTALDVMVQAQILDLLHELSDELNLTTVLVTHDLGLMAEFCDRAAVMKSGEVVELGQVTQLVSAPNHPYTESLFRATAQLEGGLLHTQPIQSGADR